MHERRHSAGRLERAAGIPGITKRAGLGTTWSPRELRHSFVSIMSDQGVPIETIADLVGHAGTSVTEAVLTCNFLVGCSQVVVTCGGTTV